MDMSQVIKGQDSIVARAKELKSAQSNLGNDLNVLFVSIVMHVVEHKDPRILNHVLSLQKSCNISAMKAFFTSNLPLEIEGSKDDIKYTKWDASKCLNEAQHIEANTLEEYKQWLVDLLAKPWFTYKAAPEVKALNLPKRIESIKNKVDEHLKTPIDGDNIPKHYVQVLKLLDAKTVDIAAMLQTIDRDDLTKALQQIGFDVIVEEPSIDADLALQLAKVG